MTQTWDDTAQIVMGLILQRRLSEKGVRPELFPEPYDTAIKLIQSKEGWQTDDVVEVLGVANTSMAYEAAKQLNGLGEQVNWPKQLERSFAVYQAGNELKKLADKLQRGAEVDWTKVTEISSNMVAGATDLVPLSEVEPGQVPFIKTGYRPIDKHLGGIPKVGLVTVGGNPGVGKTSWLIKLATRFCQKHKDKKAAIFTLEMMLGEFAQRALEIDATVTPEVKSRILVSERVFTVGELVNAAARVDNLGLIGIDFADLLVPGEMNESEMAIVYKSLAAAAKRLKVPIILLAQLSRNYSGGVPFPYHIRYTSLAEALSWMILMLYAPTRSFYKDTSNGYGKKKEEDLLPITPGKAYMVCWKCRGGFRVHKNPGAIQTNWLNELAWSDTPGTWFDLGKGQNTEEDDEDD